MENSSIDMTKDENDNEKHIAILPIDDPIKFSGISPLKKVELSKENRPLRISIEGNIGAGKSTCIQYFSKLENVEAYAEPIEAWRNVDGENLFELHFKDMNKWVEVFLSYVQLTRLNLQTSKPKKLDTSVQIFERSIQDNRFLYVHRKGSLNDAGYAVLDQWFRWLRGMVDCNLDFIVYIRTTPKVVYERMKVRNRPEESGLTLEFLTELHEIHEEWLMSNDERFNNVPLFILNGNLPLSEMLEQYKIVEKRILEYQNSEKKIFTPEAKKASKNLMNDF